MTVLVFLKFKMNGLNILLWLKCKETLNHYYIYCLGSKAFTIKLSYLNNNVFDKLINCFVSQDKYGFISRVIQEEIIHQYSINDYLKFAL